MTASLHVVADVDGPTWASDHALGLRPDASPYGLHRLADNGVAAVPVPPDAPGSPASARIGDSLRHRGGGWEWWAEAHTHVPAGADLRICWDERTGVPAALRPGGPAVATGVIWLTDAPRVAAPLAFLARRALRRSAAVWVLSTAQLPVLRDEWGVPERSLHWLPFGIDAEFWSLGTADSPAHADRPLVLGVGNDRHRDHSGLVTAVAGLPARLELVTALPIDVPPDVGERVPVLDHVALRSRYAAASVVAVLMRPNRHVSGVTTVLEAQAMGRPVVVTDTPGMRDYVSPDSAVLVPPGDPAAARRAIADLLADRARVAAMGAAGRDFVRRHATTELMTDRLAEILAAP